MQWFSLVGERARQGALGSAGHEPQQPLLDSRPTGRADAHEDFRDADTFVQAIGKLLAAAPDFLVDSYLIWLNVPDYDRSSSAS